MAPQAIFVVMFCLRPVCDSASCLAMCGSPVESLTTRYSLCLLCWCAISSICAHDQEQYRRGRVACCAGVHCSAPTACAGTGVSTSASFKLSISTEARGLGGALLSQSGQTGVASVRCHGGVCGDAACDFSRSLRPVASTF